jgi:hypothetical protein
MTLPNIDSGTLILLAVGCALLCVVGIVLFFGLQIISTAATTVLGFFNLILHLVNSGPAGWCGCLLVIFACAGCAGVALFITTCNTNPNSINFCLFLPRR